MMFGSKRPLMAILAILLIWKSGDVARAQEGGKRAVVYTAMKIITMDESVPEATAVAVADGEIKAVGSLDQVRRTLGTQSYDVVDTFEGKVLVPGFIDNHLHPLLVGGFLLQADFITPYDWTLPSQKVKGVQGRDAYLARLKEVEAAKADPEDWLLTWGHSRPFHGEVWRADLDEISPTRPILVWARSFHEVTLNTAALKALGFLSGDDPEHHQVHYDKGWFLETGYKAYLLPKMAKILLEPDRLMPALKEAGKALHLGGITTVADMAAGAMDPDTELKSVVTVYENDETPFRTFYVPVGSEVITQRYGGLEQGAEFYAGLPEMNTHRIRWVKQVKLLADGAFYSQLMQMQDGYTDGHEGEWIMPPDELERAARVFWNRGWQIHVHVNGDLGMKVTLDVLEKLLKENPRDDHRFTLHHTGYFTKEQAKRIGELGAVVSAQPFYLYALGEKYSEIGLEPERAHYMVRLKSLLDNGVKISLHSDFTMAPAEPLKLAWVAVNRLSASGKVLGPDERVTVEQALRAITIDAAYAIRMEDEIGSIEAGKVADFTVLEQDPYAVPAAQLKDIPIWGTVFEGKLFPIER
jgi:predicted amidohydrolase YtcJ